MRLLELAKAFQAGKLQKWIYWRLVREKMKILTELQEVLVWNSAAERIEIRTDGIVFVHARGGGQMASDAIWTLKKLSLEQKQSFQCEEITSRKILTSYVNCCQRMALFLILVGTSESSASTWRRNQKNYRFTHSSRSLPHTVKCRRTFS